MIGPLTVIADRTEPGREEQQATEGDGRTQIILAVRRGQGIVRSKIVAPSACPSRGSDLAGGEGRAVLMAEVSMAMDAHEGGQGTRRFHGQSEDEGWELRNENAWPDMFAKGLGRSVTADEV